MLGLMSRGRGTTGIDASIYSKNVQTCFEFFWQLANGHLAVERSVWGAGEAFFRFLANGFDDRLVSLMPRSGQTWPPFPYDRFD